MQDFDITRITEAAGSAIPLAILLIEDDGDRLFVSELYLQYRPLMYRVAGTFFQNHADRDDVVGETTEILCDKCQKIKSVNCNKRASYIISIVRNVCLARLRDAKQRNSRIDFSASGAVEAIGAEDEGHGVVFDRASAMELLNSFQRLKKRDKDLIRMRHIDMMHFEEIGRVLGMNEGAVRTALSRAKMRLIEVATTKEWDDEE